MKCRHCISGSRIVVDFQESALITAQLIKNVLAVYIVHVELYKYTLLALVNDKINHVAEIVGKRVSRYHYAFLRAFQH